jgi:hypothetical protein
MPLMADDFDSECDRLSQAIDSAQFERLRWARNEAPMLEHLVELAKAAIADRPEFELSEEGSVGACRRFVLKVHSFRIAAVNLALDGRTVTIWGEVIERGRGRLADPQRRSADYADVDQAWMRDALQGVFREIQ